MKGGTRGSIFRADLRKYALTVWPGMNKFGRIRDVGRSVFLRSAVPHPKVQWAMGTENSPCHAYLSVPDGKWHRAKKVLMRIWLYPAGMHCPAWDDVLISSSVCLSVAHGSAGSLFVRGDMLEQVLCHFLRVDFDCVFSVFPKGWPFQMDYRAPISIARWR